MTICGIRHLKVQNGIRCAYMCMRTILMHLDLDIHTHVLHTDKSKSLLVLTNVTCYNFERCGTQLQTHKYKYAALHASWVFNCSLQIAVDVTCHILTRWWRHLRLYVEMQSEDSHVRASRVRVVAIGWGREKVRKGGANEVRVSDDRL